MASTAIITSGKIIENSGLVLLSRVQLASGANAVQSDISTIIVSVYEQATGKKYDGTTAVGYTGTSEAVSAVMFNTLQLDNRWPDTVTGYNLAIPLSGTYFPNGSLVYQVQVRVTPVTGDAFTLIWVLTTFNTF
jgi:hypothetical protein